MRDEHTWEELVLQVRSGDRAAEDRLFRALEALLRNFFLPRVRYQKDVADDLVQNTLLRVHQGLPRLQKPESLKAFVLKMALFELHDYYRGRHSLKEQLLNPEEDMGNHAPENVGAALDLEKAMEGLSDHARRILELRAYGYRYAEIAQMLNTTEAAVKMQVKRAFERMRTLLTFLVAGTLLALLFPYM